MDALDRRRSRPSATQATKDGRYYITSSAAELTITAQDRLGSGNAGSGVRRIEVRLDGGELVSSADCAGDCSHTIVLDPEALNAAGQFTLYITATDAVGNSTTRTEPIWISLPSHDVSTLPDDGTAPDVGAGPGEFCNPDPDPEAAYCSSDDLFNPSAQAAVSAPSLRSGGNGWGIADDYYSPDWADPDPVTQNGRLFNDSRFAQINVEHVRRIVPWDLVTRADGDPNSTADDKVYTCQRKNGSTYQVAAPQLPATHQLQNVDDWIARAQAAGKQVTLSIGKSAATDAGCYLPPDNTYAYAVNRIMNRYSTNWSPPVRWYTAWNEPNHPSQPTSHPARHGSFGGYTAAGRLWRRASNLCKPPRNCKVAAGDFLDSTIWRNPQKARNLFDAYMDGADTNPTIWAWHAYGAGRYRNSERLRRFMSLTSSTGSILDGPRIWLTEQGGRYDTHRKLGRVPELAESLADEDLEYILALPAISDRITRLYVYHWRSDGSPDHDSGLIRQDGNVREMCCTYYEKVRGTACPEIFTPLG